MRLYLICMSSSIQLYLCSPDLTLAHAVVSNMYVYQYTALPMLSRSDDLTLAHAFASNPGGGGALPYLEVLGGCAV